MGAGEFLGTDTDTRGDDPHQKVGRFNCASSISCHSWVRCQPFLPSSAFLGKMPAATADSPYFSQPILPSSQIPAIHIYPSHHPRGTSLPARTSCVLYDLLYTVQTVQTALSCHPYYSTDSTVILPPSADSGRSQTLYRQYTAAGVRQYRILGGHFARLAQSWQ